MHAAALRGALVVAALTVPTACGAERHSAQPPGASEPSARFSDVTTYLIEGEKREEVITGAFDWVKMEGWTEGRYADVPIGSLRQVGDDCFSQDAGEHWNHWKAEGEPPLCDPDLFQPPRKLLEALRAYGKLESVGQNEIRGVSTTHYRVVPTDAFDDRPDQWLDIWLDTGEAVHRLLRPSGEASPRIREYFDFGVDVDAKPPPKKLVDREPAQTETLTPEEARRAACAGSNDSGKPKYCFAGR